MKAISVRRAGRLAVGAMSFLALAAACAQGTNSSEPDPDPFPEGMAGTTVDGGTGGSTTAGTSSAGQMAMPTAGKTSTGTAGTGGVSATGGVGGAAVVGGGGAGGAGGAAGGSGGKGGAGGAGGKAGSGGGGAGGTGTGGTGGMAGMAGSGGSGGSGGGATGYRYAKLVATSELAGNVWSSVAELQILTTGSVAISRTGWVVTADSQELDDQMAPATAAIDGNNATYWHTAWEPAPNNVNDAKLPHSLTVDMTSAHVVIGFSYLPRPDNANGRIKDWQFFLSKDGTTWGTAVKTGTFVAGTALQTITF